MNVVLFGATGMVGLGVLRECLLDPEVERVLTVVRGSTGQTHEKLREIIHSDLSDLSAIQGELAGFDACFFCLGVSSSGMSEADYTRVTYDLTLGAATLLARLNPGMTFVYVSGAGTGGRAMWARVKGRTENALLDLPFKAKYMFRPGFIQPMHGIKSKTRLYRILYAVLGPLFPLWKVIIPKYVSTTEAVGRAMIAVVKRGAPMPVLENRDINRIASEAAPAA
jgi:uncharacterized protein YbjT (DUF2867 family)